LGNDKKAGNGDGGGGPQHPPVRKMPDNPCNAALYSICFDFPRRPVAAPHWR
jgi:hypothetical protein